MSVETKPVKVVCPTCNTETKIEIPTFIVQDSLEGVVNVQVPAGACCLEHSFIAFVDKKFKVRGYQNVDVEFKAGGKEKTAEQKKAEGLKGYTFTDMVGMVGPDICATILRGILAGVPILLLDTFDLYDRVDKTVMLLKDTCTDELEVLIEKIAKESLENKKKLSRDAIIVVPMYKAITRSPFREAINTRYESSLLQETVHLPDRASQIVFLRKELAKINMVIEDIVMVLKTVEKLYEEDISTYIKNKFNFKIEAKDIDVIRQVIAFKHDKKEAQKITSKYADFLT
ncbi:MAG TPA: hypothetical protein VKM55_23865 [Candidatus Lokiarchaeia archaeon]|nr:hypothetical protein [Candidatus Lokiarchaeia archaeon]